MRGAAVERDLLDAAMRRKQDSAPGVSCMPRDFAARVFI
jgi:hypothetical protein